MPMHVEPNVQERILITRFVSPVDPERNVPASIQALTEFARQVEGTFFVISDVREFDLTFDAITEALDMVRRSLVGIPIRAVVIGSGKMVELAAQAITQKQYGSFEMAKVFATEAEALAYCRTELGKLT